MKKIATAIVVISTLVFGLVVPMHADEEKDKTEILRETFPKPFPIVWTSIKKALAEVDCLVEHEKYSETDEGTYKGKLTSLFCVLASGEDSTEVIMERYSKRIPYIRGASWSSVRMQYLFYVTELADGTVEVKLKGEISGYEDYITNHFHYFASNGVLEHRIMERLGRLLAAEDE